LDVDGITGPPDGIESPYVLFAGKLVPQKRPDRFLDIVEMLVARGTQCRFVICGAGPLEPALRARVERSPALEHVVTFAGHTAEMARFLRFAECLALTSDNESSPGIAVEAMMSGCPVVAFEVDGVREIIGSAGGVVVPQGDTAAFATAVERRIESPATPAERDEIGSQASRFATEDVVDRYVEIMGLATDVASAGRAEQPGSEHSAQLALVVPNFGVGGLERGTVSLARAAQASGVGVVVVTLTAPRMESSRTLLRELSAMGVDVENVGLASPTTYRHPIRLAVATVRLRRILLASSATAVSSAILDADLPARLAARLLGIPHTCHLVNTTYTETVRVATGSRRLTFAVARLIERATSPLSRNYIALTNAVAEYAVADLKIPARKVVVIGRGVDITRFTPSEGPRRHPPVEFVSLGRLVPQKDHACTVAAFQSLGVSSVRLRVFGEGPLRDELLTMIEADCDAVVALHDPTDDVPELLRGSDVYVSSARWEGQSNALLEAMAAGRLLVLSDIDVFREVAGDCAFFFAPGDSGQLACRVSEILDADESSLDARRHAGRRIACERYSERELAGAAVSLMVGDG
jgi:glycosyltransferase involved in cell wall biosynthesis